MVPIDRKLEQDTFFLRTLLYVIIDSSDTVISELYKDFDEEISELIDDIHSISFSLLVGKTLYCHNRVIVTVTILCISYYACNKPSNLFQTITGHLSFTYNIPI